MDKNNDYYYFFEAMTLHFIISFIYSPQYSQKLKNMHSNFKLWLKLIAVIRSAAFVIACGGSG